MLKSPRSEPKPAPLAQPCARLAGEVKRVSELSQGERAAMLGLMRRYFDNVQAGAFERDLAEKEWAILLREVPGEAEGKAQGEAESEASGKAGAIRGFSTLMRLEAQLDGEAIVAFFSGDTIIERSFWGESLLPRLWARLAFGLAAEARRSRPQAKVYWFLIASGYKTYRFLPVFFRDFTPRFDRQAAPFEARALQVLGQLKFGAQWDAERGVVRFEQASPLRAGVAEIADERLRDPHIAFFARLNPGHACGDELACLCPIEESNLTRAGRRMLGASGAGERVQ